MTRQYVPDTQAESTLRVLTQRGYMAPDGHWVDLALDIEFSSRRSSLYDPGDLYDLRDVYVTHSRGGVHVEVTDETTQEAAWRLSQRTGSTEGLALLNFASARRPGGGFLNGAVAQEEDLCRCSGLYLALLAQEEFYREQRRVETPYYGDHLIYSPEVPFFKVSGTGEFLNVPFRAAVITGAAPNQAGVKDEDKSPLRLSGIFHQRWQYVLAVAADRRQTHLVLGAWGCGVFGNDPAVVAMAAWDAIDVMGSEFRHITFAVPTFGKPDDPNYAAFCDVFGG